MNMPLPKKSRATVSTAVGLAIAALIAALIAAPARATTVSVAPGSGWHEFDVDNQLAQSFGTDWIDFNDGSSLQFEFTVAAGSIGTLTVVDAAYAGDTFAVTNFGTLLGQTSSVAAGTLASPYTFDYDVALANPSFSHGVFRLTAGNYRVSGSLLQSVTDGGVALDSTVGALQLDVAAVPEPSSLVMLLAGLGAVGLLARRRAV